MFRKKSIIGNLLEQLQSIVEMSSYSGSKLGLNNIIWIESQPTGGVWYRHNSPRIKFVDSKGDSMPKNVRSYLVPIEISENPKLLTKVKLKDTDTKDLERIKQWIILNKEVLLAYWRTEITTNEMEDRLVKLDGTPYNSK